MTNWPFADPENVAVFATKSIVIRGVPILWVSHDENDGSWQFHDGTRPEVKEAMIVGLRKIVELDPTIAQLADLPLGWKACRSRPSEPWQRERLTEVSSDA